jgi:4-carboxymuconolactone decarboxylase
MAMTARQRTARIPMVTEPDEEQAALLAKSTVATSTEPPNLFKTLVNHPTLMQRVNALGGVFMAKNRLDARTRELAILRVACRTDCAYEHAQHVLLGQRAGLSEQEIARVTQGDTLADWPEGDRLLLVAVDELLDARDLSQETFDAVTAHQDWDTAQTLEFTALVGFYAMLAGVINAAGVELDRLD